MLFKFILKTILVKFIKYLPVLLHTVEKNKVDRNK